MKVDLPKLEKALETNPELLAVVNNAKMEVRYGRFLQAMQLLESTHEASTSIPDPLTNKRAIQLSH